MLSPSNSSFKICRSEFTKLSSSSTCSRTLLLVVALQKEEVIFFLLLRNRFCMKALLTPLLAFSTFLRFFFIPLRDDTRPHVSKFISVTVKRER